MESGTTRKPGTTIGTCGKQGSPGFTRESWDNNMALENTRESIGPERSLGFNE